MDVPRLGKCWAMVAELTEQEHGHLVLARSGDEGFTAAEWNLLRGMARILDLSMQMLCTMDSLRQRQRLMEHLYDIQRSISRRMPLQEVLETVVTGVKELLGDDIVGPTGAVGVYERSGFEIEYRSVSYRKPMPTGVRGSRHRMQ